jgi:putative ABC transport system permease protein
VPRSYCGYALWQSKFGGADDVVGRVLQIDEEPYTVVGILPPTAVFPASGDYWIPEAMDPHDQRARAWEGVGRLKAGVTLTQAQADLMRVHKSLIPTSRANKVTQPLLAPLRDRYLGNYRLVVLVLMAMVGFVLLISCANVSGLLMSRGQARARELAVRAALGAGKRRLVQQALSESLLLATVGACFGVAFGWLGLRALLASQPGILPSWVTFHLDVHFTLFALGVTGIATALSSLGPALAVSRLDMRGVLADAAQKHSLSRGRRLGMDALVVCEIAVAMLLLTGGGLSLRAFWKVLNADPGFATQNVLTFALNPPYETNDQRVRFYESVLEGLRSTPGVDAAGGANRLPVDDSLPGGNFYQAEGQPARPVAEEPLVAMPFVTPGYFRAMGIALREGREFDDRDRGDSSRRP